MRRATLRQLRALAAVAASRRVVGAARELHLTAPAVTQQLQQLEAEAGLALFNRTRIGLEPTAAGQIVLEAAQEIEALLALCEERLAALKGLTAGRVSVGVVSTAKYFSPRLIAGFARQRPGIEVRMSVGNREDIIERLRALEVDVAIMGRPPLDLPVEASVLGPHPLVIVAPPDHRLAGRRGIRRTELLDEVFLLREEGSGTRSAMTAYLAGLPLVGGNLQIELGSNETIKQAVMAGLGIAFLSAHTVEAELESGRLVLLDVDGLPVEREWFAVRRRDKVLMPAAEAFLAFVKAEGTAFLPNVPGPRSRRKVQMARPGRRRRAEGVGLG